MAELISGSEPYGSIFEPLLPPLQSISSSHQGPLLIVVSTPLIIIAGLIVFVRLYTVVTVTRTIGPSEVSIVASIACFIGYITCINRAVARGLGNAGDQIPGLMASELRGVWKLSYHRRIR
jgi:hypothetical protein